MINPRRIFIISILLVVIGTASLIFFVNKDEHILNPVGGKDRPYYFRVELSQWSIKIIDLNRIEDMMLDGASLNDAYKLSTYFHSLGKLEKESQVFLQIYSLDVQHGLIINELDVKINILESTENIDSTIPYYFDFITPNKDITVMAYCQVYCGLGHSNMKLKLSIGNGSPNYGHTLLTIVLIVNAIIALIFLFLTNSPIKRKLYLLPIMNRASKSPNSKLSKIELYDISMLSEKELVALRLGTLDISKSAILMNTIRNRTTEEVKQIISTNGFYEKWKLIEF